MKNKLTIIGFILLMLSANLVLSECPTEIDTHQELRSELRTIVLNFLSNPGYYLLYPDLGYTKSQILDLLNFYESEKDKPLITNCDVAVENTLTNTEISTIMEKTVVFEAQPAPPSIPVPILVLSFFPTKPCHNPTQKIDLTTATASSNGEWWSEPKYAIDGNIENTKWQPKEPFEGDDLLIDLGSVKQLSSISLYFWITDRPESHHIDVSTTGDFTGEEIRVVTETDGLIGFNVVAGAIERKNYIFSLVNARYIKLMIDKYRNNDPAASGQVNLYEFEVYSDTEEKSCFDQSVTGDLGIKSSPEMADTLSEIRNRVNSHTLGVIDALEQGSIYHGYKDLSAEPSLDYYVYDTIEFLSAIPESPQFPNRPDYMQILNDINICNYVDNFGVKEVLMWGYHHGDIAPEESDMAMGTLSQNFWNMPQPIPNSKLKVKENAQWGDLSNSAQSNDLPICQHTYTLVNPVYEPSYDNAVHNHLHQIENVLAFAGGDYWCDGGFVNNECVNPAYTPNMFWDRFGGKWYNVEQGNWICGNGHFPPNVINDYDYSNSNIALTSCPNWKPDGSGTLESVDCSNWGCNTLGYYIWWMQNIPGKDNGLIYNNKQLRNWWEFIGDFDSAVAEGKSLTS